ELPLGSTPIDFAYRIHTEVGHRCVGARVNGRLVPLDYKLNNGDIVEIITSKHLKGPSADWLRFVRTSHARSRIKRYLKIQTLEENAQRGREMLLQAATKRGIPEEHALDESKLATVMRIFHCQTVEQLLAAIGYGDVSPEAVLMRIFPVPLQPEKPTAPRRHKLRVQGRLSMGIALKDGGDISIPIRLSRCCRPIPGDPIIGYVTRGRGLTVHRRDCRNVHHLMGHEPNRFMELEWQLSAEGTYQAELMVEALDRVGLLSDIAGAISEQGVNIASCNVETSSRLRTARVHLVIDITGPEMLQRVIDSLRQISDVTSVVRVVR
ncbi:MAG TPA: bifunctional (p)ppGpp synthetase/guanosine-3',5'-bis(diphosphate) 3'-pyrophosphohydrolase, partial [Armatimonadetes bacterium]|nr:bifunctional (p)ppGpp synthetase/guanosine-3',5'-bis(diphosphate) 3'-pyrophosphohydrolase [Armatimonadota bacterium]